MTERVEKSADFIKMRVPENLDVGLVLGSGLGNIVEKFTNKQEIPYSSIPSFPVATVKGHGGKLVFGKIGDVGIAALQGRFHLYEGFSIADVVFPIQILSQLGAKTLILTTASGSLNPDYLPGDFMIFKDFISFVPEKFSQFQIEQISGRKNYLDPELIRKVEGAALKRGIKTHRGVFVWVTGPNYETKAEIEFYSNFGDAISMSTVPEIIIGKSLGMKILGISCITNSPFSDAKTTHEEVLEVANRAGKQLGIILEDILLK